jgi:hypothetical protein
MAQNQRDENSSAVLAAYGNRPVDRLLAAVEQAGQDEAILAEILWLVQAHPELVGFVEICRHLQQILPLVPEVMGLAFDHLAIDTWYPILDWVAKNSVVLAKQAFQDEGLRGKFLRSNGTNPLLGTGAKEHGLCCLLWESHPDRNDAAQQRKFRLLEAHLLLAHAVIVQYEEGQHHVRWELGAEPYHGFLESLYVPTLAARKFIRRAEVWRSAFRALPVLPNTQELVKALQPAGAERATSETTSEEEDENVSGKNPDSQLSEARGNMARFLQRALDAETYRKRFREDHGDRETEEGQETEATVSFGDADDTSDRHAGNVHFPLHWDRSPARKRQLLEADEHPGEAMASQNVQLADDEAAVGLAKGGSLEKANQLLPWSYSQLSSIEVARSLRALRETARERKPEALELFALVSTVLWTGSSLEQATSLQVRLEDTPDADCDLSLCLGRASDANMKAYAVWRVRALALPYRTEQKPVPRRDRRRRNFFDLPDVAGAAVPIEELLLALRDLGHDPMAQPEAMRQQAFKIFSKEWQWYRARLRASFQEQDPSGRTTIGKIGKLLMQHIVERSGGDLASAALITGTDHYLASVRRFYATPAIPQLETMYCDAVSSLAQKLAEAGHKLTLTAPNAAPGNGFAVGSRLCPTRPAVQKAIRWLRSKGRKSLPTASDKGAFETEFISRHNWYTLYCVWSFGLAVGMRGIRTPYLHLSAIDPESGFATISDKDSGSGYHLRLIWVPPKVRQQMQLYEAYLTGLKKRGLPPATRTMPCYFLDASWTPRVVRPATIQFLHQKFFPFPSNVGRRFIRTELLEQGFPPEIMDAWMGHWFQGEEPWGMCSSLSFAEYRRELERTLVPFLDRLGLRPMALRDRP